jgi:hypothetical protein
MLRVAFQGRGGIGSEGNPDGDRMREAIGEVLAEGTPAGLVIDLIAFEYRFGDWIAAALLVAAKLAGRGRTCVLATGETAAALRSLWEQNRLDRIVPVFGQLPEALRYLSGAKTPSGGRGGCSR